MDKVVFWQACEPSGLARPASTDTIEFPPNSRYDHENGSDEGRREALRAIADWDNANHLRKRGMKQLSPQLLTGMSATLLQWVQEELTLRRGVMTLLMATMLLPIRMKGHIISGFAG